MENRKLKSLRTFYNIKQKELSELLNVSLNTYSSKERGNTPFFQGEMISIVKFFKQYDRNITMDDIFFNKNVTYLVTKIVQWLI